VEARRLLATTSGGIGRYPNSGFIHIDPGDFRTWDA